MKNLYLLPTENISKLAQSFFDKSFQYDPDYYYTLEKEKTIPYQMYIVSNEEIEDHTESCWCLDTKDKSIKYYEKSSQSLYNYISYRKIILTTDHSLFKEGIQDITEKFLKWFVKNSNCDFVNIELYLRTAQSYNYTNDEDGELYEYNCTGYKISLPQKEITKIKCHCNHNRFCDCV